MSYEQKVERLKKEKERHIDRFIHIEEKIIQSGEEVASLLDLKLTSESKPRFVAEFQDLRSEGEEYLA